MRLVEINVRRLIESIAEAKELFVLLGELYLLRLNCMLKDESFIMIPETPSRGRILMFDQGGDSMQVLHRYPKIKQEYKNDTENEEEVAVAVAAAPGVLAVARRPVTGPVAAAVARCRPAAKRARQEGPLFPLNLGKSYKPMFDCTWNRFKEDWITVFETKGKKWPCWRTFRNGLYMAWGQDEIDGDFCILFGDPEVDEKLDIESAYCIGTMHKRANYRGNAYKFLKAGSLNDVGAPTRDFLRQFIGGGYRMAKTYEKRQSELWNKATIDLSKYHEE